MLLDLNSEIWWYGKFFKNNQTGQEQPHEDASKSNSNPNSNEQKKD